ncbi:MAG TPA: helix-turn-helix domain-containing protein [Candidatus Saccharimonadales bacterium]|nr:helix-turn-helix domain-containing protein [Candidatus Saccharimonadales bacterium]
MDLVFKALADPVRRKLLDELADTDGQTLFGLCSRMIMRHQLAISRQAVTKHLLMLERAGLIRTEKQGRYKLHYLQTAPIADIYDRWIAKHRNERN